MTRGNQVALFFVWNGSYEIVDGTALMKRATLAATLLCCVAGPALAQSTPQAMSPQDQRKLESLSKDQAATKAQATTTINVLAQNQSECLKAIGNAYFRNCIAQAIPVGLDFIGYVTVLSRSKGVQHAFSSGQDVGRRPAPSARQMRELGRKERHHCTGDVRHRAAAVQSAVYTPRTAIDGMLRLFRPRSDGPVRYLWNNTHAA